MRGRRPDSADRPDRQAGSATIWMLSTCLAVLALSWAAVVVALAIGARHHAESAADLAALAGAAAVSSGADGCAAAAEVAVANHAQLASCHAAPDQSVTVSVAVVVPSAVARWVSGGASATSRAGP